MYDNLISKYVDIHSWLYVSIKYNRTEKIEINEDHGELHVYRENDDNTMINSVTQLKAVNRVKTLHIAVTISNISSADGRRLNIQY